MRSWCGLGRSWGSLAWSWGDLGAVLGGLGVVLAGLGAILDRSWVILAGLGVILRLFWVGWGSQTRRFSSGFSMFLAKSKFRTKMVILAGLEAFLGPLGAILVPLGAILGPLGTLLGRPYGVRGALGGTLGGTLGGAQVRGGSKERASRPFGDPPLPKLLAKANSD